MIGYIFGIMITNLNYTRFTCFLFLTFLLSLMFLIEFVFYFFRNQFLFIFFRIFINSLDANFNLYNFESFPTLTRPTGVAINRIFGKLFNLWTPLLMISYERIGYFSGFFFGIILFIIGLFLGPRGTKNNKINELPIELINEFDEGKISENPNEEKEYLLKK